jgi:uncharacterized protein (TIGR02118 family)
MIKRVSLVRRRDGMTHEEFVFHWLGVHADIVRKLPGLRGLRFGVVRSWSPGAPGWDGIGEIWFDSEVDAQRAFAAEPHRSLLAEDRAKFVSEVQWCFVEEYAAVAPPQS